MQHTARTVARPVRRPLLVAALMSAFVLPATACSGAGSRPIPLGGSPVGVFTDRVTGRSIMAAQSFVIGPAARANHVTLLDAINASRPLFLSRQSATGMSSEPGREVIGVYIDGAYAGGADVLSGIPAHTVAAVHRISSGNTLGYFGRFHPGGALYVALRR